MFTFVLFSRLQNSRLSSSTSLDACSRRCRVRQISDSSVAKRSQRTFHCAPEIVTVVSRPRQHSWSHLCASVVPAR